MVWMHSSLPTDQLMVPWASSNLSFMHKTAAVIRYRRLFCEKCLILSLKYIFYIHTSEVAGTFVFVILITA